jgi:hypothetical protein
MKTILLAVDDKRLDAKAFEFALQLCRRLEAGLDILHIVRPIGESGLKKIANKLRRTSEAFEKAMVAATFAEAGLPETAKTMCQEAMETVDRLTPPDTKAPVDYRPLVTEEGSGEVLSRYIGEHRNVVLTVYDYPRATEGDAKRSGGKPGRSSEPLPALPTPVVLVNQKNNQQRNRQKRY